MWPSIYIYPIYKDMIIYYIYMTLYDYLCSRTSRDFGGSKPGTSGDVFFSPTCVFQVIIEYFVEIVPWRQDHTGTHGLWVFVFFVVVPGTTLPLYLIITSTFDMGMWKNTEWLAPWVCSCATTWSDTGDHEMLSPILSGCLKLVFWYRSRKHWEVEVPLHWRFSSWPEFTKRNLFEVLVWQGGLLAFKRLVIWIKCFKGREGDWWLTCCDATTSVI